MSYTKSVREFTIACNSGIPETPVKMTQDQISFIREMINDELAELSDAKTVVEQADALVDAIYYLCDCAVKHGMNLDPLFHIVHAANMSKVVNGKVLKRADGKVIKPAGWVDPNPALAAEIQRQTEHGSFSYVNLD